MPKMPARRSARERESRQGCMPRQRPIALVELIITAALVLSTVVAVTAVSIGFARAEVAGAVPGRRPPVRDCAGHRTAAYRDERGHCHCGRRAAATLIIVFGGRSGEVTAASATRGSDCYGRRHSGLTFAALMI